MLARKCSLSEMQGEVRLPLCWPFENLSLLRYKVHGQLIGFAPEDLQILKSALKLCLFLKGEYCCFILGKKTAAS